MIKEYVMLWYSQAVKLVNDKLGNEDGERLLMPLMVEHNVSFTSDLTWIVEEFFGIDVDTL